MCDIIASIVSVADSIASDAIALEDTKPLLGYHASPDPTASSSTRPRGESYDGQIISSYTGSCSLYIHTINLLKDTVMATISMFQSLGRSAIHQPTFMQLQEKLVVLYDQLLDRIKQSQQKLVMNTKVDMQITHSPTGLLTYSLTYSLTYLLTHSYSPTYSPTYSLRSIP